MSKIHAYDEMKQEKEIRNLRSMTVDELYPGLNEKKIPLQFTPFRKILEKNKSPCVGEECGLDHEQRSHFPNFFKLECLSASLISLKSSLSKSSYPFKGGEKEALKRLHAYLFQTKKITTYKQTRNQMHGTEGSTKLSAYLSLGCLSPCRVLKELHKFELQYGANESSYWLFFELLWREFFRHMYRRFGIAFFQLSGIKEHWPVFKGGEKEFHLWSKAKTGEEIVDSCMMELISTGFLSNRARQIAASYLVNDLNVDWRLGAQFFEKHLIDYDVYSNWGNWMYQAGVGFDPRGKRWFNPKKQADQYDSNGGFRDLWSPYR